MSRCTIRTYDGYCDAATGKKRRKVAHTSINNKGEEVTEEVWEEEEEASQPEDVDKHNQPSEAGASHCTSLLFLASFIGSILLINAHVRYLSQDYLRSCTRRCGMPTKSTLECIPGLEGH